MPLQYNGFFYKDRVTEEEAREIIKCKKDPIYFMETYVKILHPTKGYIPFKLYEKQKELVKTILRDKYVIVLKSRQVGVSTLTCVFLLWMALFFPDMTVGVLSISQREASRFLDKMRNVMKNLPPFLMQRVVINNRQSILFANNSLVMAGPCSENPFRSETLNFLFIDEGAFNPKVEVAYNALLPTLSRTISSESTKPTGCLIVSTPYGVGNWYYRMWMGAKAGINGYTPFVFHWKDVPEFDEKWYEEQCRKLNYDRQRIAQELDLDFISSATTFFDPDVLVKLKPSKPIEEGYICLRGEEYYKILSKLEWTKKKLATLMLYGAETSADVAEMRNLEAQLKRCEEKKIKTTFKYRIYEEPEPSSLYVVGVDVASSGGSDFSAAEVIDVNTACQVAEIHGKGDIITFARCLMEIAHKYNDALIAVENNGIGAGLIDTLLDLGYLNLVYEKKSRDGKPIYGINVNTRTRPVILNRFYALSREYHPEEYPFVKSDLLIDEMKAFIYRNPKSTKPEAAPGAHDDCVMAFALGLYARDLILEGKMKGKGTSNRKVLELLSMG